MCTNFQPITLDKAKLFTSQQLCFVFKNDIYPHYDTLLLFANQNDLEPQWRQVRFGLIPKWAESTDITKYTYNARSETVMQKPSFSEAWHKSQFALIPVQTIYEPYYKNDKSQRWGIYRKDNQPFTVAAIYEVARIQGEIIRSIAMLTIDATNHPLISQFHCPKDEKRSIVVIPHHLRMNWLKCHYTQVISFLNPMSDEFTAQAMPRPPKNPTKSGIKQDDLFSYAIFNTNFP